jgi:hypothetical protein
MKNFIALLFIISLISCKEENDDFKVQIEDIQNLTIIDPYESHEDIPDTVYYYFKANNKMTKILYDYELNGSLIAYSAESGHPFRKLTDTFLEKKSCVNLKNFSGHFSKFSA